MVYKALSWALRQLAIHDAQAVRDFLQEQQGVLAARVVREVQNKLTTGLKNPRKKALAVDITT
jgi:3-methyladenine DNA glycosylase AlkD